MAQVSKITDRAIRAYAKVYKLQEQLDRARAELASAIMLIPGDETSVYYAATQEIRNPVVLEPSRIIPPGERGKTP